MKFADLLGGMGLLPPQIGLALQGVQALVNLFAKKKDAITDADVIRVMREKFGENLKEIS